DDNWVMTDQTICEYVVNIFLSLQSDCKRNPDLGLTAGLFT
ncbi:unnamed protein product, partial [marine sediment metagenome]